MTSEQAASAACITGKMREQIRKLHQRDGLDAEQIAEALGIPVLLISQQLGAPNPKSEDELNSRCTDIENHLESHKLRAADVLTELMESNESDAIRFASAREVLRITTGDYRPKKQVNANVISPTQFNIFIKEAARVHEKTVQSATKTLEKEAVIVQEET